MKTHNESSKCRTWYFKEDFEWILGRILKLELACIFQASFFLLWLELGLDLIILNIMVIVCHWHLSFVIFFFICLNILKTGLGSLGSIPVRSLLLQLSYAQHSKQRFRIRSCVIIQRSWGFKSVFRMLLHIPMKQSLCLHWNIGLKTRLNEIKHLCSLFFFWSKTCHKIWQLEYLTPISWYNKLVYHFTVFL